MEVSLTTDAGTVEVSWKLEAGTLDAGTMGLDPVGLVETLRKSGLYLTCSALGVVEDMSVNGRELGMDQVWSCSTRTLSEMTCGLAALLDLMEGGVGSWAAIWDCWMTCPFNSSCGTVGGW